MQTSLFRPQSRFLYQPTILIVEDNLDDLYYLSTALKMFGCNCLTANNSMAALSIAQREQPDLIFIDIRLPEISGIELLNTLRIDWLTRNIPVVAVTGLAGVKERQQVSDVGFDRCLTKPYLLQDIENIMHAYLSGEYLSSTISNCN